MARQHFYARGVTVLVLLALAAVVGARQTATPAQPAPAPRLMTPKDLDALPSKPADQRVTYGTGPSQYGELRVPAGGGPHPLVILIHGGCFKFGTLRYFGAMADALEAGGIATWNIEYRRLGEPGSGWPGTYLDVARAVDQVRVIAKEHRLDLDRVVVVGHSAGGHLAMWTAARGRLPAESDLYVANSLKVRGVVNLAGPMDMTANIAGYEGLCGDTVITSLLGGTPSAVPQRYAQASAMKLLPLGVPQVIVVGEHEEFVPLANVDAYVKAATAAGDRVRRILIPTAGHFEVASPLAFTWPQVEAAITSLLGK
jgi:acetyl esterase/lipase